MKEVNLTFVLDRNACCTSNALWPIRSWQTFTWITCYTFRPLLTFGEKHSSELANSAKHELEMRYVMLGMAGCRTSWLCQSFSRIPRMFQIWALKRLVKCWHTCTIWAQHGWSHLCHQVLPSAPPVLCHLEHLWLPLHQLFLLSPDMEADMQFNDSNMV